MLAAQLLVSVLVLLQTDGPERYQREAAEYCAKLEQCTQFREANRWLVKLREMPGADARLDAAYRLLGTNRRLDFWLLTAFEPRESVQSHPWRPLHTGCVSQPGPPWKAALERELARRPEKLRLWMHLQLYALGDGGGLSWLGGRTDYLEEKRRGLAESRVAKELDAEKLVRRLVFELQLGPRPSRHRGPKVQKNAEDVVRALRIPLALCGRYDLIEGLAPENWRQRAAAWEAWLDENQEYLRYDPREAQFVIDRGAKQAGRPLPPQAREITGALYPLPRWEEGLVEMDDALYRKALRQARRHCVEQGLVVGTTACYRAEARYCLEALDEVLGEWEAHIWLFAMQLQPGARERMEEAGKEFATGKDLADYWLLDPREGLGHANSFELEDALFKPLVDRAREDPQIALRAVHLERFRTRFQAKGAAYLMERLSNAELKKNQLDVYRLQAHSPWYLWGFMESFALSGRSDLVRGLTPENFEDRLLEWADWYDENRMYLRFDEQRGYLIVDEQAKQAGEEIPLAIPPSDKPLPDWKGPVPILRTPERTRPVF